MSNDHVHSDGHPTHDDTVVATTMSNMGLELALKQDGIRMLRAPDLIWSFIINHYLLGKPRGFVMEPGADLMTEAAQLLASVVDQANVEERTDQGLIKEALRTELRRFLRKRSGRRPFVLLKAALSLDGRIATAGGDSRWITGAAEEWTADRLGAVERTVLRIAVHELDSGSVPREVAIDEAMRLAKRYATDDAAKLVNGILGRIAREAAV